MTPLLAYLAGYLAFLACADFSRPAVFLHALAWPYRLALLPLAALAVVPWTLLAPSRARWL